MKLKLIILLLVFFGWSVEVYPKSPGRHFMTPAKSTCLSLGGKWGSIYGSCKATFPIAKKICRASGGRVPTQYEVEKLIRSCGETVKFDDEGEVSVNYDSWSYTSCYRNHGFPRALRYHWTTTKAKGIHKARRTINMEDRNFRWQRNSFRATVACIR